MQSRSFLESVVNGRRRSWKGQANLLKPKTDSNPRLLTSVCARIIFPVFTVEADITPKSSQGLIETVVL